LAEGRALARLKGLYARPAGVPFPEANPYRPAKAELGRRLFFEPLLSRDGGTACATCHDPAKGFGDGRALGRGVPGTPLARHTPTLWNLAWAPALFWDGHAGSLEEQARGPVENPLEMAQPLALGVAKLAERADYRSAFAAAFPAAPVADEANLLAALATFERTLVSPETRFDRWVAGAADALSLEEQRGFLLFNGKAGCAACHEGWSFTDHAFHDIGLPGDDRGRGAAIGLPAAEHAFKTPTLRELGRTAPYAHDGRFATLSEVLDHYAGHGMIDRPTVSPDLRQAALTPEERQDLLAFLGTLTAEAATPAPLVVAPPAPPEAVAATDRVAQKDRRFAPGHVRIAGGTTLRVVNDDARIHNVRVSDPRLAFDSGAQEPGQTVAVPFPAPGRYQLFCGIHPTMRLTVEVESDAAARR
jgi:cytochrome c peroxidase